MSDMKEMREILFRAKHIHALPQNEHLDGAWIEGYLCDKNYINSPELEGEFLVDEETISQYTGYTDLRKKKAFEHGIVFCEDNQAIGYIVYKEGQFLIEWGKLRPDLRRDIHFWFTQRRIYIIGNIFDHPELLEVGYGQ